MLYLVVIASYSMQHPIGMGRGYHGHGYGALPSGTPVAPSYGGAAAAPGYGYGMSCNC